MIDVFVDVDELNNMSSKLDRADTQSLLLDCANASLASIKTRVFENGIDSDGGQIGTYSEGYMKVRTGNYPETRLKRGKNKGDPRPRYNRTADTKVVGSLTREMENDMKVVVGERDVFIGFSNEHDFNKSQWLEETYKKDIWDLTVEEVENIDELVNDFIDVLFE